MQKTIEFVHMEELFRKVPINTFDLINNYSEEVVTLKLESFRIKNEEIAFQPCRAALCSALQVTDEIGILEFHL